MILPTEKNLFSIFFEPFIHFLGNKTFSEKMASSFTGNSAQTRNRPTAHGRASPVPRAPPRPGRNLGLGQESSLAPSPAWAERRPILWSSLDQIRRLCVVLERTKLARRRLHRNPSSFALFRPLLLSRAAQRTERAKRWSG